MDNKKIPNIEISESTIRAMKKAMEIPESTISAMKEAQDSYLRLAQNAADVISNMPKIQIPDFAIPPQEAEFILSPNIDIIQEDNVWKRHKQILDIQNSTLEIQAGILNEQKSTTKLTIWILVLTVVGILVTIISSLKNLF